jgi:hypothetical protein
MFFIDHKTSVLGDVVRLLEGGMKTVQELFIAVEGLTGIYRDESDLKVEFGVITVPGAMKA